MGVVFLLMILGHSGGEHIMGTASAVSERSITIATAQGKDVVLAVDAATKFEKAKKPATIAEVKVGVRVVAHAKRDGETLRATLIKVAD
ncbi:MAG: DUF5666 domain-containing protein [Myxococcota bacterium]|nr:DUF5666 domain-containing protein [Myxococcota bacterium]